MNKNFMTDRTLDTHPAKTIERIYVNLCDPVQRPSGNSVAEFCPDNTYVCRTTSHQLEGKGEIVTVVDTLASDKDAALRATFATTSPEDFDLTAENAEHVVTLSGGYILGKDQKVELTLQCGPNESKDNPNGPVLQSDANGVMKFNWRTSYFCATRGDNTPPPTGPPKGDVEDESKSVIGWFFTLLGFGLLVYFVGGCFYNYRQFNARGLDLLPHRDFWLDLPYLIKDLVSHLMSTVTSRRQNSGGYVAV
ncbi:hypothetical protein DM01DRAFT_1335996 [Hesseltinella vesiculosa]|uniref:Autophagy-related protein 27 n=1 Tax=Hesseltinella vesiculosa TaxID=101127 RepID=A0A1X2GI05_9FUNG|nr:hypothetical protein DM01DRAFT_1335996 [Hesseltinella vesiculosa]